MYYANKTTFYVKQYGPIIFLFTILFLIVGCGSYLVFASTQKNTAKTEEETVVAKVEETSNTNQEVKEEETSSLKQEVLNENINENINSLGILEKSNSFIVDSISNNGEVILKDQTSTVSINLIGIEFDDSYKSKAIEKMKEDLVNKKIVLSFDNKKTVNSKLYAYIYLDDTLYNASLINDGYVKLKIEKDNVSLLDKLLIAQTKAKNANKGLWN